MMNRKSTWLVSWLVCGTLLLSASLGWCQGTTTLNYRGGSSGGESYFGGNDIYVEYDSSGLEGGGCMWIYSNSATPSFWDNNVFLKGYGYITKSGTLENTGALRFGEGSQTVTTPVALTGDVTLLANASIGIEVASNCNLLAYITGEIKTSGEAEGETFTLRKDASANDRSGTLVITNDNTSLKANWDIRKGVLQVGAVNTNFTATGYEWTGEPKAYTQNTAKVFSFDGTTGGLGTGSVELANVATLKFARSNDYTISNAISGSGKIIFSGGGHGTLTGSIANTIASIEIESGTTFQANSDAITNAITGTGFYQVHYTGSKLGNAPSTSNLTGFSGVLLISGDNRWGISETPGGSYDIGAVDSAQLWVTASVDISKNLYLSGIGWNSNERFGALRLAGNVSDNTSGGLNMSHITGNVALLGDTRISARIATNPTIGMISGKITGEYALSTGGNVAGTLILTGENSYGATNVVGTTTLQIGHIGKINGNMEFDGTQGTLGTGNVNIDSGATLKFVRSDAVAVANSVSGNGSIVFEGGGDYSWTGNTTGFSGTWNLTNGAWTVAQDQTFTQAITIGASGELAGSGTVGNVSMEGGKIHSTLTFTQDDFTLDGTWATILSADSQPTIFDGDVDVASGSLFEISLLGDFLPDEGDTFFLLAGSDTSFKNLDLSSLVVSPTSGLSWVLGTAAYGDGIGLYAQVGVPEPSCWALFLMGGFGLLWLRRKARV
ncbi:MAG: PEP-CTERM sorting domain-containing protein [Planctomycetia bacterium]|nr:PEP-CTERM sorting domain-containing protein [Planctomycetia bacterium]